MVVEKNGMSGIGSYVTINEIWGGRKWGKIDAYPHLRKRLC